ncbi:MAG: DUF3098 domain-containing protein [Paludibacteraceae bacterium]|nr:DUF3098 domain-containing protein [Paludibacteraceae bacterium]
MSLKEQNSADLEGLRYRLGRKNLLFIAAGLIVVILGFVLMMVGPDSGEGVFEPDIFSFRRIVVAPLIVFFGYMFIVLAIFLPFNKKQNNEA